jgi:hypothetical protein
MATKKNTAKKKKAPHRKKMDPALVSWQPWEIAFIAKKYNVGVKLVRSFKKKVGRSRKKLYAELRAYYSID